MSDVSEALLPRSVPDLQLYSTRLYLHCFQLEVYSDRRHIVLLENVIAKLSNEIGLADTAVSHDDDLGQKVMFFACF